MIRRVSLLIEATSSSLEGSVSDILLDELAMETVDALNCVLLSMTVIMVGTWLPDFAVTLLKEGLGSDVKVSSKKL